MTAPSEELHGLGPAEDLAKDSKSQRLAMTLQCVAVGSMAVLAITKATHVIQDLFGHTSHERHGRSR